MRILMLVIIIMLSSCGGGGVKPEQKVIIQTKYVIKLPPAETLTLPLAINNINVDTATQAEVAEWLIDKDTYTASLEDKIKEIAKFFNTSQTELNK